MAITSQVQHAGFPLTFEIKSTRLSKQSRVKISRIRTLSIERIGKKIGAISAEELEKNLEGLIDSAVEPNLIYTSHARENNPDRYAYFYYTTESFILSHKSQGFVMFY